MKTWRGCEISRFEIFSDDLLICAKISREIVPRAVESKYNNSQKINHNASNELDEQAKYLVCKEMFINAVGKCSNHRVC